MTSCCVLGNCITGTVKGQCRSMTFLIDGPRLTHPWWQSQTVMGEGCQWPERAHGDFPGGAENRNPPANAGDGGSILVWEDCTFAEQLSLCTTVTDLS